MSLSFIRRRPLVGARGALAAGTIALCATFGAQTASAVPVSLTLNYQCNFPLLKVQPLKLTIASDIPATATVDTPTNAFDLKATASLGADATTGLTALEAVSVEGSAIATATVALPGGGTLPPLKVNTVVPKTALPASGPFTTTATGQTPELTFSDPGTAKINVGDLVLNLTPRLADGTKSGLDTFESECFQVAGQANTLATINIVKAGGVTDVTAPTKPGGLNGTPSANSVSLAWSASSDDVGVSGYDVYKDGVKVTSTVGTVTTATVSGLTAKTAYKFAVIARDASGKSSAASDPLTLTTTAGGGTTVRYGYTLAGTATLKTLVKGTLPLSGGIDADLSVSTGDFTAALALNPTSGKLTALGFLPVTAKVQFVSTAPTTGTLVDEVLKSNSKVRIKLPQVSLFGLQLAGGSGCQTKSVSNISLSSGPGFQPLDGGTLTGTFSISDLTNCGFLTGIVSPLTAGKGNAIALKLTPKTA